MSSCSDLSSVSLVVSDPNAARKSTKTEMRRRRTHRSPFKVPDSNSLFQQDASERRDQKEEMRKFLALPIEEKTAHAARMMAKMKNELVGEVRVEADERKMILKQIKSKTVLPKQTSSTNDPKITKMKRENISKESKHDLIIMERQKAVLELSLLTKRSDMMKMDKDIAKEEKKLKQLEKTIERENQMFEEYIREYERKSVEARTCFEQEEKSRQETNIKIKKLAAEIETVKSEIASFEEILIDFKKYKEFLFRISPPEWQDEQKLKTSNIKVSSKRENQDNQIKEPPNTVIMKDLESKMSSTEGELPSDSEPHPSSAQRDTQEENYPLHSDSSEDEAELYFTDPQQLLDLMTDLTEQNLSLIQNSARVEEVLRELRKSIETTRKKIEKEEEQITLEIKEMNQKINREKARSSTLQHMVDGYVSLSSEDQESMLDALSKKVEEVHGSCVHDRVTNLSTLEKVADIENRVCSLLQRLENIPEESLKMIEKIKDSEKRSRQREEMLREQKEKQNERMRRYLERSLAGSKKITGGKLMPRCFPVTQKVTVITEDNAPDEDDIHGYPSGSEDTD